MIHGKPGSFWGFLSKTRTLADSILRNRRKMVTTLIGGYVIAGVTLGIAVSKLYTSNIPQAQAATAELATVLKTKQSTVYLGERVDFSLAVANTALVAPTEQLAVKFFSTNSQLTFDTASIQQKALEKREDGAFLIPLVGPQVDLTIDVTAQLSKATTSFLGVFAEIGYQSNLEQSETKSNRVFLSIDQAVLGGKHIVLTSTQPSYKKDETVVLKSVVPESMEGEISGRVLLVKQGVLVREYQCVISAEAPCSVEWKELSTGGYTAWFLSDSEDFFSNTIALTITSDTPEQNIHSSASISLPLGSASVAGRIAVRLQDVITRNQAAIKCTIELAKKGSEFKKQFETLSGNTRECNYWIASSELDGFGQYTVTALGSDLSASVTVIETPSFLPLAVTNTVLVQGQAVSLESKTVHSASVPEDMYSGNAEISIFNPKLQSVQKITSIDSQNITYSDGSLAIQVPEDYFNQGDVYFVAVTITEVNGSATLVRHSEWATINFGAGTLDISSGIQILDMSQLQVGGKPVFVTQGVVDMSGVLVNDKECKLSIYQQNVTDVFTTSSQIKNGECRIALDSTVLKHPGKAVVTLWTDDAITAIAQSRVVDIAALELRSVGSVKLANSPAQFNKANQLVIGPVRGEQDNLITNTQLTIKLGQEAGVWLKEDTIEVSQGYGSLYIPASMLDSDQLFVSVFSGDEALSDVQFATTQEPRFSVTLPNVIHSGDMIEAHVSGISGDWLECSLTVNNDVNNEITAPVDVAAKNCIVRAEFPKNTSEIVQLTVTVGDQSVTSMIQVLPTKAAQNFVLLPVTHLNNQNEIELQLVTSPLVDANGLLVNEGQLTAKLNGRDLKADVRSGIARLSLPGDFFNKNDIYNAFGKRVLDLDIDASVTVRAKSNTSAFKLQLGARDIAVKQSSAKINNLATIMQVGTTHLVSFSAEACDAWLVESGKYNRVESIMIDGTCWLLITPSLSGTATLEAYNHGALLLSAGLTIADQAPVPVWSYSDSGSVVQLLSDQNYQLSAVLYDGDKEYHFSADPDQSLTLSQQGLASEQNYLVRLEAVDSEGVTQYFFSNLTGAQLQ